MEIVALIDGDRAVWGDPDFEFAGGWAECSGSAGGLWSHGTGRRRQPSGGADTPLYRIFYQLIGVYVGLVEYNDPDMYQNSRQAIRELL